MKILYIHQYFNTPDEPGGTRSYWISQELIKHGHEVVMLTSKRNLKRNQERANKDGIEVIYLNVLYDSGSMSVPARLWAFLKFVLKTLPIALRQKDVDLVIATSTPLTVGIPALVLKWFRKKPYVFEVRDLWPEVPIQMGGLNNKLAIRLATWLERTIYKHACHIVALSPGMHEGVIAQNTSPNKVSMIPNMSKIDEFWVREKNLKMLHKLGLNPNSFKVIYFGAMNIANGMHYIIDAAKFLKDDDSIEFVFLGSGASKDEIMERCRVEGIKNAHFPGSFPMHELSEIVNLCDVSLVTFLDIPILSTNSPNKLFDSLSAGKPIIVNSRGWTKDMVNKYNCGYFVDPDNPEDLAAKLVHLKKNPSLADEMGKNSRKLAETNFDKSILCDQFVQVINKLKIPANASNTPIGH